MTVSDLKVFNQTTELTHIWVNEVAKGLGLEDKHRAFQGLRATLHVLRDRLTLGEAANLGAELPILLAGFYYEGWKPESTPIKTRSKQDFLEALQAHLHQYFPKEEAAMEPEQLAKAVFQVLCDRVPAGEMADVVGILSAEIKDLFPQQVK
jgi:uncharacterized protein (DUF2267 family)